MITTERFQQSAERARAANLEAVVKRYAMDEERKASQRQIEQRRLAILSEVEDPLIARVRLERILQGNELSDINYLAKGVLCARSVCRIAIRRDGKLLGYGTGFLIGPGVLMTNHHVFPDVDCVRESVAQFRYERSLDGTELNPVDFRLRTTPEPVICKALDMTIASVESRALTGEPLDQFGWLRLDSRIGKAFVGEYLTIVQHPKGERKQVCVRENKLLLYSETGPYLWYQTDTVGGSSGSPVFNNSWDVVALHHSSVPQTRRINGEDVWIARNGKRWTPDMGDDEVAWKANEGVRISAIVQYLRTQYANHPLAQTTLSVSESSAPLPAFFDGDGLADSGGVRILSSSNGHTRILLPVDIDVSVGKLPGTPAAPSIIVRPSEPSPAQPIGIEKVEIDQSNYAKRSGYASTFLGSKRAVPLPKVKEAKFGRVLTIGNRSEIKYWNYSVVLNRPRGLAYFSAANIDPEQFRGTRGEGGDRWFPDPRVEKVDPKAQITDEFYKKQKEFEADRSANPFDQGHLTRRKDLQWGATDREAKRNGDDSFHYPNCSPQHWQFNQNNKASGIWFRLEDAAIDDLGDGGKLCLINGPVFDAPVSKAGADGRLRLNLKGARAKDPVFGGVKIPKQFFKVIAYVKKGKLSASAFVVTQEDLLKGVDRLRPEALTDAEVRLYQVKIADLETLTGLDFGSLGSADTPVVHELAHVAQGLPIEDELQLAF